MGWYGCFNGFLRFAAIKPGFHPGSRSVFAKMKWGKKVWPIWGLQMTWAETGSLHLGRSGVKWLASRFLNRAGQAITNCIKSNTMGAPSISRAPDQPVMRAQISVRMIAFSDVLFIFRSVRADFCEGLYSISV